MKLSIKNLTKTYSNGTRALNNINLEIGNGMFGLLGPNGAGKSTLMRTLTTLQEADFGSIFFNDINIKTEKTELRKHLGYLPQEFGVYPKITAEQLLNHIAILKGITSVKERKYMVNYMLNSTNLYNDRKKKLGTFSGGMRQRFGIAQALINNPSLIIVDEPTAGLDPAERNRFLNILSELGEDKIVILSTHIVEDIKELCSDMAIINEGKILLNTPPRLAIAKIQNNIWKKQIDKDELAIYKEKYCVISEKLISGKPEIHVYSDSKLMDGFIGILGGLEDVYFTALSNNS
jgi:ABC-2 type transport system ATP-binding protein